jgi:hypothetical protein
MSGTSTAEETLLQSSHSQILNALGRVGITNSTASTTQSILKKLQRRGQVELTARSSQTILGVATAGREPLGRCVGVGSVASDEQWDRVCSDCADVGGVTQAETFGRIHVGGWEEA